MTDGARPRPQVAVGAVVVSEGRLLLVRRAQEPEAGRWSLPGGRVEGGEQLAAAVEREVGEETGLEVRCREFLGWVERIGALHHFVILDFVAELLGGTPAAGSDVDQVCWAALSEVSSLALVEGLHQFLADHGVL